MGYPHQSQAQEEGDKHGEGEDKDKVKVVTEPEIATWPVPRAGTVNALAAGCRGENAGKNGEKMVV